MKKLLYIAFLFISIQSFAQTTPYQLTQVNQMTWYKDYMDRMWAFRGTTLGYKLFPDSAQVARMISGAIPSALTFNNGITKTGNNVGLGSSDGSNGLNRATIISQNGNPFYVAELSIVPNGGQQFALANKSFGLTSAEDTLFSTVAAGTNALSAKGVQVSASKINPATGQIFAKQVFGITGSQMYILDQIRNKGLEAAGNYEANYTSKSYTSKRYVDSANSNNVHLVGYTNQQVNDGLQIHDTSPGGYTFQLNGRGIMNSDYQITTNGANAFFNSYIRNGIALVGITGNTIATFNDANGAADNPNINFMFPLIGTKASFSSAPVNPTDVVRLQDIGGVVPPSGYATKDSTLAPLKNLFDIPNKTTARNNLSVYSKAQDDSFLSLKQDSSALTRLLLNGKLNQVAKGNGANPGLARLMMFFFDSLTDGAGTPQTTFRKTLIKIIRSYLGDGGPGYFAFDNAIAIDGGATWGFGGPLIPLAITDANGGKYSIDGRGLYTTTGPGSGCFINWNPASNWTNGRVFYLKQPGGGTFSYGTSDILSGNQPVLSTDSAGISLGWIDIPIGAGTAGKTLQINNITGKVVLFGTLFTQSTTGVLFADCAKGGRLQHDAALQDTVMLRRWFNVLKPTDVVLNGGMNDRLTISAAQHFTDNITFIAPIKRGNPLTHVTIVQSNEPSDAATTNFLQYTPQKISAALATSSSYYDERDRLGNYANAVSRGYMFDNIHPNGAGNIIRAQALASALGFAENGNDPGFSPYPAGSSTVNFQQTLVPKSFLSQAAGTPFTVETLGFINGFPNLRINLQITGVRNGTNFQVVKNITMAAANGTNNNQATDVNRLIVTPVDTNTSGGDFTVSASLVSNKLVITVTPSGFLMNFIVTGEVTSPYNITGGQLAYQN